MCQNPVLGPYVISKGDIKTIWCNLSQVLGLQEVVQAFPCHPGDEHHHLDSRSSYAHQTMLSLAWGHAGSIRYIIKNLQH